KNSSNVGKASLSIDHRGSIPTRNLFSNITAQIPFGTSGDSGTEGVKAGQYETYWNVRGVTSNWPSIFGKATKNIVGATGKSSLGILWYEAIPNALLVPQELHSAQFELRHPSH
ncbi:MAG: hypothetical protein KBC64_07110, partial [Simkaniaceae bacterium]|nr:hypothetical protein [Simkaniaceae bacterium]